MLNCCVTATKDTLLRIEDLDQFGEIGERSGETVNFVDHDHIDQARFDILEQLLQGRAVEVAARKGGVVVAFRERLPAFVRPAT